MFAFCVFLPKEDRYIYVHLVKGSLSFRTDELFDPASVPTNSRSVKPPLSITNPDSQKLTLCGCGSYLTYFLS